MKKQEPCVCGSFDHKRHSTCDPNKDAHTPTPWRLGKQNRIEIPTPGGGAYLIAEERALKREDAAFIVRAVNCHEELVAVAKAILSYLPYGNESLDLKVRAAIAKAESRS